MWGFMWGRDVPAGGKRSVFNEGMVALGSTKIPAIFIVRKFSPVGVCLSVLIPASNRSPSIATRGFAGGAGTAATGPDRRWLFRVTQISTNCAATAVTPDTGEPN